MAKKLTDEEKARRLEARKAARAEKIQTPEIVEVSEKGPEEKKSFFERMTGHVQGIQPTRKKRTKKIDPTIITQVAPLVVSTLIVTGVRSRIPDPYKVCSPSQEEVVNMVKPYFNILSRYVEITGHLSENTIDLISALLASIIYGTRAYVTYVNIQEMNDRDRTEESDNSRETRRITPNNIEALTSSTNGSADDTGFDRTDVGRETKLMDDLFKRDLNGRRRLGLL